MKHITTLFCIFLLIPFAKAQHSVARLWNEVTLLGISTDQARPTVHARNLFHTSVAMYDAWAVYNPNADTYLLGKMVHGFHCGYRAVPQPVNVKAAQEEAMSFAVYRILKERFVKSPGKAVLYTAIDALMDSLGYDKSNISTNYKCGAAEMGNYIAKCIIAYGLQDGSNEAGGYANLYYKPVNIPLIIGTSGNPGLIDMNRWQPLQFTTFVDQSGISSSNTTPSFLSPEWGNVAPFAMNPNDAVVRQRDDNDYRIYHDPGSPALLDTSAIDGWTDEYKWNFAMVAVWSSLLDPSDHVMVDISPGAIGNNTEYPTNLAGLRDFYDFYEGGDPGMGRPVNPKTGAPYVPQIVPRGDYTRVLAEFWADGPKSDTPPGHWFDILNYVNDQPGLTKRIGGEGPLCDNLEWDVKAYFALGGAMHDAAISAWSIKGWYDSVRPVSAIRAMAERGQSSDPNLPRYNRSGLPLIPGYIELVNAGDPLQGSNQQFIGEVKVKTWLGPTSIGNPNIDVAGVGWILAKNWWPYQRPTFVTPPFAGYISGHSTYSRAAAEVLTAITGDAYFPGGMGTFFCKKNEFLVFEDGPSVDLTLQWATYRDASDQCSLSRIYGGIHPPMDDIPGRLIGIEIGVNAFNYAEQYFTKTTQPVDSTVISEVNVFPNPSSCIVQIDFDYTGNMPVQVFQADGKLAMSTNLVFTDRTVLLDLTDLNSGVYVVVGRDADGKNLFTEKVVKL